MGQENGQMQKNHPLDKSLYYKDHLHLVELGNAKFLPKRLEIRDNLMLIKLKLKPKVSCRASFSPSLP